MIDGTADTDIGRKSLNMRRWEKLALILIIPMFAMVPISIDSDSWLKLHIDRDGLWTPCRAQNADIGLETFVTDGDDGLLCDGHQKGTLERIYLQCQDEISDVETNSPSEQEIEDVCGHWNNFAKAGEIAESYILIGTFISFVGLLTMMSPLSNMYKLTHKLFFCAGGGVIVFSVYTWNLMLPEPPETYMFWGLMPIVLILIGSALFIGGTIGLVEYLYHSRTKPPDSTAMQEE